MFDRAQTYTTTPGHGGWTAAATGTTPTKLNITEDGGAAKLTLTSTSEAQIACLYQNDILIYDLAHLQNVWYIAKVAGIEAVTTLTIGVGSARNDTADTVATNAWFRMEGSVSTTAVVVETDDATTDNNDKATGETLAAVYKKFLIDFSQGLSDVRFFIDGDRVATATTFDMSALTAGLNVQPIVQIQKASGTGVPSVTIAEFGVQYKTAYGA